MKPNTNPIKTRILLVDDHDIMREGLRLMIQREPDLEVVGEAGDEAGALEKARQLAPHLVLMDIQLTDGDGIEASRQILAQFPNVRILVLSGLADVNLVHRGLEAGIKGYLLKTNAASDLVRAIRTVMSGNLHLCPEISQVLILGYQKRLATVPASGTASITEREREVLKLTADGLRIKEIATRLNISGKTVETHRSRLMQKLNCGSSAELTRYAIREGISTL